MVTIIRRELLKLFLLIFILLKITSIAKLCFLSVTSVRITSWKISAKRGEIFELFLAKTIEDNSSKFLDCYRFLIFDIYSFECTKNCNCNYIKRSQQP